MGHSDPELVCDFWTASALAHLPLRGVEVGRSLRSDYEPCRRAGIPVIDFSSLTGLVSSIIHTDRDTVQVIDREDYYESYRLLAVYLAVLDERLGTGGPGSGRAGGGRAEQPEE